MIISQLSTLLICRAQNLADDIRSVLRQTFPDMQIVAHPEWQAQLLPSTASGYDLILLDQQADDPAPIAVLRQIKAALPTVPVMMLIDLATEELAEEAQAARVDGLLLKTPKALSRLSANLQTLFENRQRKNRLETSEEKLRMIFEHAFDGISIYEELPEIGSRRLIDCNERYAEMAGRPRAELLSIGRTAIFQKPVGRRFSRAENQIIRYQHRQYRGLFSWVRPDGRENVIEYSAAPIDVDGRPLTIGIDRDITEQILSQQATHRRAAYLSALNAVVGGSGVATDLSSLLHMAAQQICMAVQGDLAIVWVGDALETVELSKAVALALRNRFLAEVTFDKPAVHLHSAGNGEHTEYWLLAPIVHEDVSLGGLLVRSWEAGLYPEEAEALAGAVGREIGAVAARMQLLSDVQLQALQLQFLLDAAPQALILLDGEQRVLRYNSAAQEMIGAVGALVEGEPLTRIDHFSLKALLQTNGQNNSQEVSIDADPPLIYELTARPLDAANSELGWLLVIRNVTQLRERQQRREQQARLAAVGQLAAGIAHDFNNILASVLLFIQLTAQERQLSDRGRSNLDRAKEQVDHAAALIRQILDFGRRSVMNRSTEDMTFFLQETTQLLRRTLGEHILIRLFHAQEPFPLEADFGLLQQVCLNLAVNARDAMPQGGELHFRLDRLALDANRPAKLAGLAAGDWYRLRVRDTGTGIPPEILGRIFEPFFTTKEVGFGSGLGLAQVYGIVQQHKGEIHVESEVGQGTTFSIYLPAPPEDAHYQPVALPSSVADSALGGATILVVEDDAILREAIGVILEIYGFEVISAADGAEALALFAQEGERIALVLSDMAMPGMTGLELHRALRQQSSRVRTVILSGYPLQRDKDDWRGEGIVGWLQKPIDGEKLAAAIRSALARHPLSTGIPVSAAP